MLERGSSSPTTLDDIGQDAGSATLVGNDSGEAEEFQERGDEHKVLEHTQYRDCRQICGVFYQMWNRLGVLQVIGIRRSPQSSSIACFM